MFSDESINHEMAATYSSWHLSTRRTFWTQTLHQNVRNSCRRVQWCRTRMQGPLRLYLGPFTYVAALPSRRGLRSSCSDCLVQTPVHRSTFGSRAFSVAGPQAWNCLPPEVTSAPSLATFRTRLKSPLFTESFADIRLIWHLLCMYTLSIVEIL